MRNSASGPDAEFPYSVIRKQPRHDVAAVSECKKGEPDLRAAVCATGPEMMKTLSIHCAALPFGFAARNLQTRLRDLLRSFGRNPPRHREVDFGDVRLRRTDFPRNLRKIFPHSLLMFAYCEFFICYKTLSLFVNPTWQRVRADFACSAARNAYGVYAGVPAACLTAARGILRRSAQKPPHSRLHLRTPVASVSGAQYKPYTSESLREG